jgi:hypothetical protein
MGGLDGRRGASLWIVRAYALQIRAPEVGRLVDRSAKLEPVSEERRVLRMTVGTSLQGQSVRRGHRCGPRRAQAADSRSAGRRGSGAGEGRAAGGETQRPPTSRSMFAGRCRGATKVAVARSAGRATLRVDPSARGSPCRAVREGGPATGTIVRRRHSRRSAPPRCKAAQRPACPYRRRALAMPTPPVATRKIRTDLDPSGPPAGPWRIGDFH